MQGMENKGFFQIANSLPTFLTRDIDDESLRIVVLVVSFVWCLLICET